MKGGRPTADAPLVYRVEVGDLHAHLFRVTLTIARPAELQTLRLPVWIPGSYLVREFSKNLQRPARPPGCNGLHRAPVRQEHLGGGLRHRARRCTSRTRSMRSTTRCAPPGWMPRAASSTAPACCLQVQGQTTAPHRSNWWRTSASPTGRSRPALAPVKVNRRGFGTYLRSRLRRTGGLPGGDGAVLERRLCRRRRAPPLRGGRCRARASTASACSTTRRRICEAAIRFWHGDATGARRGGSKPPHQDYLFMLNVVDDAYGGLEHRNSTALIAARKDLPRVPAEGAQRPPARGLHHLAGADQPRVFPHLEHQAAASGRVCAVRLRPRKLHRPAVVLRGLHQLLRRPAAAPRRPDRRCHLPAAVDQDRQPGAADAGAAVAERGAGQLRRLGQVLPAGREHRQCDGELLHQGRLCGPVPGPEPARQWRAPRWTT